MSAAGLRGAGAGLSLPSSPPRDTSFGTGKARTPMTNDTMPRGVYAAVLTPLTAALEPDAAAFVAQCRWLLEQGCDGLAPLGTTGEANSLSVDQRRRLIDAAAEAGIPGARMIPGTGSCALADAVTLSRAALATGAAGVLLLPPFY